MCGKTCSDQDGNGSNHNLLDVTLIDPKRNFGSCKKTYLRISLEWQERITSGSLCSLGKDRCSQGSWRMGFEKYISLFQIIGNESRLVTFKPFQSLDKGSGAKIHRVGFFGDLDQESTKIFERCFGDLDGGYQIFLIH